MRVQNRSWPHPVLAPFRDDVLPNEFSFTFSVRTDKQNFYLDYEVSIGNDPMRAFVGKKLGLLGMHIECRRNFFRSLRELPDVKGSFTISANDLRGRTEVFCCVLAARDMDDYRIEGQHADYGSLKFKIRHGDFLGVTESQFFEAFFDFDPLKKISSILNIRKSKTTKDGPMEILLGEQKLVAELSQSDYERYVDLKGDTSLIPLLANQVVVPALMEAISTIRTIEPDSAANDEHMELRWFRSLSARLKHLNLDLTNSDVSTVKAVQVLIDLPLRRSLAELAKLIDEGPET